MRPQGRRRTPNASSDENTTETPVTCMGAESNKVNKAEVDKATKDTKELKAAVDANGCRTAMSVEAKSSVGREGGVEVPS